MKPFAGSLVLLMVIVSLNYGESYRVMLICKDEKRSRSPFSCKQPNCEQFCEKLHPEGWGKCQDDNQFVCQCFHICYKDVPAKASKSLWVPKPMSSFNSGLQFIWCHVQVISRMLFGLFMILAIAYLLLQRSSVSTQTMPATFILLLGVGCGFAGKLCIDTLGGSGYHFLLYWEVLCLLHVFSYVWTSVLFVVLYGPISVSQVAAKEKTMIPYWIRQFLFYADLLLFLPMICGLVPFASPAEWKDHFSLKVMDLLQPTSEWD